MEEIKVYMNKTIITALLLILTLGAKGEQKTDCQINAEVSETVELMGILSRTAGFQEYCHDLAGEYTKDTEAWFAPHKTHPTIAYYQDLRANCGISYEKVTNIYKEDYRGWNNLGMCYFSQGNVADARRCYAKALAIAPNDADVNYNAGIAAMVDGDLKQAETNLGKAAGTQGDLATAMGTLYSMKGEYNRAKGSYGKTVNNNTAVQQILNEDYAGARKTLAAIENPNATTAYLNAIVAARTNDRDGVYSNMKKAVSMDASMKERAAKDIEFAKYMEDSQFLAIVK